MRVTFWFLLIVGLLVFSASAYKPSFNGSTPGCSGSGCHTLLDGVTTATTNGLSVEVTVNGVTPGKKVAGELVDAGGTVVDVIDKTGNNPFTLTAPQEGVYRVNAGFKDPQRHWDSTLVNITLTGVEPVPPAPKITRFELYPNHPNPFNPSTRIQFTLPAPEYIELVVYNIRGQIVRTLTKGFYQSGRYAFIWDGRNDTGKKSPSGVYIAVLKSNKELRSIRMVLAK